ncbi:MAG: ABC transporter ATP-binding protein/permease [Bacilli bacterium]|jgi:ATP-binding cassette subfamily B multidrug efflux pump|nr:ABC transporter ATP-binding protein/permease [Bacilli bacterium]
MPKFNARKFLLSYLKHHVFSTILLVLSVILVSLSALAPALILRQIIDQFISPALTNHTDLDQKNLILYTCLYCGSYVLVGLVTFFENYMVDWIGQKMIHELRYQMIEKSHRLTSSYFRHNGTGVMVSRVMDDVSSIETLFSDGLVSMIVSVFEIVFILVTVFIFSWLLGLIVLAMIPIVYAITRYFQKGTLRNQIASRKIKNAETNNLSESIDNIVVLDNLEKKPYREKLFVDLEKQDMKVSDKTAIYDSIFSPIIMMIRSLVIALVTYLVVVSLAKGTALAGLSTGTFAAALGLISDVFQPIQDLGQELEVMQEGVSGIRRVDDYMSQPEIADQDPSLTAEAIVANPSEMILSAKDMSFHYDDGTELIFDHANFSIRKLDKVSLIGRTGVGKTTLFRLILGILKPTEGSLQVNGIDTYKIPDKEKKKIFGYVEQGFQSIPGTVADQITLKDPSITLDQVKSAMAQSFLNDYVLTSIDGGYDAPFKEEDFSQGQLQLLGLARALVFDPKILLLDEISANLDSETEKQLIAALAGASEKRTVLSISHRLSDQLGFKTIVEVRQGQASEKSA